MKNEKFEEYLGYEKFEEYLGYEKKMGTMWKWIRLLYS